MYKFTNLPPPFPCGGYFLPERNPPHNRVYILGPSICEYIRGVCQRVQKLWSHQGDCSISIVNKINAVNEYGFV